MRSHVYRALGLFAALLLVVLGAWSCGSDRGMGTLSVFMDYDAAGLSAPLLTPLDEDFGSSDRTRITDLILSFESVTAWSCNDDIDDDEDSLSAMTSGHDDDDDEDDEDCDRFIVLDDSTVTLSVGELDSTLNLFVGSALIPEGDYDFIVLGAAKAWVVTESGDSVEAKVPSGRIKVKAPFTIPDGGVTDLLIVFDPYRSVVEAPPGSQNFIVKPVMHSQVGWDHDDDDDDDHGDDD